MSERLSLSRNMSRKDFLLAKKTLGAREVKNISKGLLPPYRPGTSMYSTNGGDYDPNSSISSLPSIHGDKNLHPLFLTIEQGGFGHGISYTRGSGDDNMGNGPATDPTHNRPRPGTSFVPFSPIAKNKGGGRDDSSLSSSSSHVQLSAEGSSMLNDYQKGLVQELSKRALTASGGLKKMQQNVNKSLHTSAANNKSNKSSIKFDDNYFMPKRSIQRSDGATLSDIYESKRADTWARILKAQLAEEERTKEQKKIEKIVTDDKFGALLRKQLDDNRNRMLSTMNQDDKFAAVEEETSKKSDVIMQKRKEDAINRHKKFISNALEDIETKRKKREQEFLEDMKASQMMIAKSRYLQQQDEDKKRERKELEAQRQAFAFQENLASIARKENEKKRGFDEDISINREAERRHKAEDKRRFDDLQKIFKRATDGPVHQLASQIVNISRKEEDDLYRRIARSDNTLNKQLQTSEDFAKARVGQTGRYLMASWEETRKIHEKEKREEDQRIEQIGLYMARKNKEVAKEDEAKREQRRHAHKRYQRELDEQLNQLRQNSLATLTKTMSDHEIAMNGELIRKVGVKL